MLLSKLGELGLIEKIKKTISNSPAVLQGIGDDCAVVKFDKDRLMLLSCDMLMEGIDFTSRVNPYLLGRKAIACSISDIAAKGGLPKYTLVALGIPKNKTYAYVRRFYKGLNYWAKKFKIDIVGRDISESERVVIDVSMVGLVEKQKLVLRKGSQQGDIIFVTGKLGDITSDKHLTFKPRLEEARFLVNNFKVNSMIDISDGLALDLSRILKVNDQGAVIYEDLLPKHKKKSALSDVLYQGEEFELLFTLSAKEAKRLFSFKKRLYTPIGKITDKKYGIRLIDHNCKISFLRPKGYRHFS